MNTAVSWFVLVLSFYNLGFFTTYFYSFEGHFLSAKVYGKFYFFEGIEKLLLSCFVVS